jgi:hypothetical protein
MVQKLLELESHLHQQKVSTKRKVELRNGRI